jgi:hypothetical protein
MTRTGFIDHIGIGVPDVTDRSALAAGTGTLLYTTGASSVTQGDIDVLILGGVACRPRAKPRARVSCIKVCVPRRRTRTSPESPVLPYHPDAIR